MDGVEGDSLRNFTSFSVTFIYCIYIFIVFAIYTLVSGMGQSTLVLVFKDT